jgi:hypothetical protein
MSLILVQYNNTVMSFMRSYIHNYYILSSNKGIFVCPIWPEVSCPYFHTPGKQPVIGSLQDHFHIEAHIGPDQYGCLFSRCRKYVINSLIHGHFHIGLVQYGGLGMITWPIWKCPCISLYLFNLGPRENNPFSI